MPVDDVRCRLLLGVLATLGTPDVDLRAHRAHPDLDVCASVWMAPPWSFVEDAVGRRPLLVIAWCVGRAWDLGTLSDVVDLFYPCIHTQRYCVCTLTTFGGNSACSLLLSFDLGE